MDADRLAGTWVDYKAHGTPALKDALLVHYTPLVRQVATKVGYGLPNSVDTDDLFSYGIFGLMDAIDKFSLERGVKFETYASPRIRGAILDEIRSLDWVPRTYRAKVRAVERTAANLEQSLQRTPTRVEIAAALDLSDEELHAVLTSQAHSSVVALDLGTDDEDFGFLDVVVDHRNDIEVLDTAELEDAKQLLASAIERLDMKEKAVFVLHYQEGLSLAKIGELLNVTESRACQIHTRAVLRLRTSLEARSA